MLAIFLFTCQLFQMTNDPVRAAEIQQRAIVERAKQHEREVKARQEAERRNFEAKFNKLVDAIAAFAKKYNGGKGGVWPPDEVEKLRKAMVDLQQAEKSLRGDQSPTLEAESLPPAQTAAR